MPEFIRQEKEVKESKTYPSQFLLVKNFVGGLVVTLEPYDYSGPVKRVSLKFDKESQHVPAAYAIGTFVTSDSALRQMEAGYFTYENLETLVEMAESLGYYVPDSIKEPKITIKELRALLKRGDVKEMEKVLLNAKQKTISDFIDVAKKMYSDLSQGIIKYITDKYKVSLEPVDLDA